MENKDSKNKPNHPTYFNKSFVLPVIILTFLLIYGSSIISASALPTNGTLPDLSGIAWVENDTFLTIHDAKYPKESDLPRASLLALPSSPSGILASPLNTTWPKGETPGSDLECIARLPNTNNATQNTHSFLIAESGDNDRGSKRIFLSHLNNDSLIVTDSVEWPTNIYNIEGCAVGLANNELLFVWAERSQGSQNTSIDSANLFLNPLKFGSINSSIFTIPSDQHGKVDDGFRPVSALEVDDNGNILIASAVDPDVDTGPFSSNVWLAGHINSNQSSSSSSSPISLLEPPKRLATLDGFKIEGLATRSINSDGLQTEIIVGTDDEDYGGVIRVLPYKVP